MGNFPILYNQLILFLPNINKETNKLWLQH
jgi:hypothetical protein